MIWSETKPSTMKSEKSCVQMHRNVGKKAIGCKCRRAAAKAYKSMQKYAIGCKCRNCIA